MKLCKDCSYYSPDGLHHWCTWMVRRKYDPVFGGDMGWTGEKVDCYVERENLAAGFCGPSAKHWEAKDAQATA